LAQRGDFSLSRSDFRLQLAFKVMIYIDSYLSILFQLRRVRLKGLILQHTFQHRLFRLIILLFDEIQFTFDSQHLFSIDASAAVQCRLRLLNLAL
jgi:hypothetical protein